MDWFRKHVDTVIILGAIVSSMLWMNGKFCDVDQRFSQVDRQIMQLEKEISIIKAVMIMKGVMPAELAAKPITKEGA